MKYNYHTLIILIVIIKCSHSFTGVFWHICDIHLNISSHDSEQRFGNYESDSPGSLVESAIMKMQSSYREPDFIIWNGDNVAHRHMNNDIFFKALESVRQHLYRYFPSTNILPSLGNHDLNPSNRIWEYTNWCKNLFKYWKNFFTYSTKEIETFERGCFYSRIVDLSSRKIKVIVLNTIIWYSANKAVKHLNDPFGQFQWMKDELQSARVNKLKVFIVGHVPPGASEYTPKRYKHLYPEFNNQLVGILQNNSDIIEAGFFAHQHTDSFKIVYSSKGDPLIPLFLSPSVTPLHLSNLGSVNPSIRLFTWPTNVLHRFYTQFHTILPDKGSAQSLNWSIEYNSTDILPSLSATNMDSLLTDFSQKNSLHFSSFFRRHLSGRQHDNNEMCAVNSSCRCQLICGMKHLLFNDLDNCLAFCNKSRDAFTKSIGPAPLIVSVIVVFTLILIATVVGVNKVYCHQRRSASLTRDIYMATYNGKDCEQVVDDHVERIAEITFGDVPEYRGHMRNNSRTILTLNDGNDVADVINEQPQQSVSKFAISKKSKSKEKYDYSRM